MDCEVAGCKNAAYVHYHAVRKRLMVREFHYCEMHAMRFWSDYDSADWAGISGPSNNNYYDIEILNINDRYHAQCIYLRKSNGRERFYWIVGTIEIWTLFNRLKERIPPRPQMIDALLQFCRHSKAEIVSVGVDKLDRATFSSMVTISCNGSCVSLDMRPSDAVLLALVSERPIYVTAAAAAAVREDWPGDSSD